MPPPPEPTAADREAANDYYLSIAGTFSSVPLTDAFLAGIRHGEQKGREWAAQVADSYKPTSADCEVLHEHAAYTATMIAGAIAAAIRRGG